MSRLDRPRIAQLVHLSGPQRGQTRRVWGLTSLALSEDGTLNAIPGDASSQSSTVAVVMPDDEGWRLEAAPEAKVWVNGVRVRHRTLRAGDVLELGEQGGLLRFRPRRGEQPYKSVREALADCLDCARLGAQSPLQRLGVLLLGPPYEMATQVAPLVRLIAATVTVAVLGSIGLLWLQNQSLERRLTEQLTRIDSITGLLESSEHEAFTEDDFAEVRSELDFRIADTLSRIEALESRATARGRAIAQASEAVVFLQGSYGFVEPRSGRPLRVGRAGGGGPLTVEGDGPLLELRYTGTGFVLEDGEHIVTNRHVAQPWEFDENAQRIADQGFVPVMRRLIGYLPKSPDAFEVTIERVHPSADAAVLQSAEMATPVAGLRLTDRPVTIGDEVVVLGYPTGMRALLARAEPDFVAEIFSAGPVGFWELAEHLARGGYIAPLATVGIIGQTTDVAIVYDAETTHGGSGGPVVDLEGEVIAVNAAILPEFGGSNLGVPAGLVLQMLAAQHADAGPAGVGSGR